jgi:hypothetical protein
MKKIITLIVLILMFLSFIYYQQDITHFFLDLLGKTERKAPKRSIASVNDYRKNVAIKRSNDTIWNNMVTKERLALMDSVSTGYDSNALIAFDIGYIINVGERSLIVIENPKQEAANLIEINFDRGSLQASNTTASNATLMIHADKTTTEVKGQSEFSINVDKDTKKAEIWIKIGEAKVRDQEGNEILVKANEKKTFSIEKAIALNPEPIAPPIVEPLPVEAPKIETQKKILRPKVATAPKKPVRRLQTNEIARYVNMQKKKIDTCYERKRGSAGGQRVTVRMIIQNTGIVSRATISNSTLQDPAVERCVLFWVRAIRFPKFDGAPLDERVNFLFQ